MVWIIPLGLLLTFPLWKIPIAAFLTPRGGYDASFAGRKLDSHNFNMEKVHITQSESGKNTLEIVAERAYSGTNEAEFDMEEVDAVITGANGEQTFITARKALFNKGSSILTLMKEVVVMRPKDKFELYTDLLIYNDKTQIAVSPGKTQVIGEKVKIRGTRLTFNGLTKAYELGGRVKCTLNNFSGPDDPSH